MAESPSELTARLFQMGIAPLQAATRDKLMSMGQLAQLTTQASTADMERLSREGIYSAERASREGIAAREITAREKLQQGYLTDSEKARQATMTIERERQDEAWNRAILEADVRFQLEDARRTKDEDTALKQQTRLYQTKIAELGGVPDPKGNLVTLARQYGETFRGAEPTQWLKTYLNEIRTQPEFETLTPEVIDGMTAEQKASLKTRLEKPVAFQVEQDSPISKFRYQQGQIDARHKRELESQIRDVARNLETDGTRREMSEQLLIVQPKMPEILGIKDAASLAKFRMGNYTREPLTRAQHNSPNPPLDLSQLSMEQVAAWDTAITAVSTKAGLGTDVGYKTMPKTAMALATAKPLTESFVDQLKEINKHAGEITSNPKTPGDIFYGQGWNNEGTGPHAPGTGVPMPASPVAETRPGNKPARGGGDQILGDDPNNPGAAADKGWFSEARRTAGSLMDKGILKGIPEAVGAINAEIAERFLREAVARGPNKTKDKLKDVADTLYWDVFGNKRQPTPPGPAPGQAPAPVPAPTPAMPPAPAPATLPPGSAPPPPPALVPTATPAIPLSDYTAPAAAYPPMPTFALSPTPMPTYTMPTPMYNPALAGTLYSPPVTQAPMPYFGNTTPWGNMQHPFPIGNYTPLGAPNAPMVMPHFGPPTGYMPTGYYS